MFICTTGVALTEFLGGRVVRDAPTHCPRCAANLSLVGVGGVGQCGIAAMRPNCPMSDWDKGLWHGGGEEQNGKTEGERERK